MLVLTAPDIVEVLLPIPTTEDEAAGAAVEALPMDSVLIEGFGAL